MTGRRALLLDANHVSMELRNNAGFDETSPVDVYDMAATLGVRVLFVGISMEGIYQKTEPPRILLSSLRPCRGGTLPAPMNSAISPLDTARPSTN